MNNKRREDEGDFDFAEQEEELLRRMIVKESFKPLRTECEEDSSS